ncbi:hypothetical protein AB0L40_03330 [Patulibacter sp. NPDC049589]|uniref:hypothetical protein n=1 Tax=Patulibacter sp. NPDC049589 TaxID=3154731 RepID=UPI003427F580
MARRAGADGPGDGDGEERCPPPQDGATVTPLRASADAAPPPQDPAAPAWPPLVRVPGGDRAALLRRMVGG